jgi:hypothetical protein
MSERRHEVERARRTLREWLEERGIEVEDITPRKTRRSHGQEKLVFKLEVHLPVSVLSKLSSEVKLRDAVTGYQIGLADWKAAHPDAPAEDVAYWEETLITITAEAYEGVDRKELEAAVLGTADAKEGEESTVEDMTTPKTNQAVGGALV